MGLNYTNGCINFRDLGEYLNLILGKNTFPLHKIYRGGSIDHVNTLEEIGHAKSILNLRNREDYQVFDLDYYHLPMSNKIDKYDTAQKDVKRWINEIMKIFESEDLKYPVLIHCLSGKDRTGIVIAALLSILGYSHDTITEEYLLSEGEVKRRYIQLALDGMTPVETYFKNIDLERIREQFK